LFLYRLALHLGYPHPDHLLQCLTAKQLSGWLNYHSIEPFGEYRSELRHGQTMALTANINRDSEKHPEPFKATDFMNFYDRPEEIEREYTAEELEAYAQKVFGA
jgi:hypothetical protein